MPQYFLCGDTIRHFISEGSAPKPVTNRGTQKLRSKCSVLSCEQVMFLVASVTPFIGSFQVSWCTGNPSNDARKHPNYFQQVPDAPLNPPNPGSHALSERGSRGPQPYGHFASWNKVESSAIGMIPTGKFLSFFKRIHIFKLYIEVGSVSLQR